MPTTNMRISLTHSIRPGLAGTAMSKDHHFPELAPPNLPSPSFECHRGTPEVTRRASKPSKMGFDCVPS
jgi:hypothetical protein